MTVSELIAQLQKLPQDMEVLRSVEGECRPISELSEEHFYQYLDYDEERIANMSRHSSVCYDYYPELEDDEDYIYFKGILIS